MHPACKALYDTEVASCVASQSGHKALQSFATGRVVQTITRGSCAGVGILATHTRCYFNNAFWTFKAQCCGKDIGEKVDEECIEGPRCEISLTGLGIACLVLTGLLVSALAFCATRGRCCCRRRADTSAEAARAPDPWQPVLGTEMTASKSAPAHPGPHAPSHWGPSWGHAGVGGGGLAQQLSAAAERGRRTAPASQLDCSRPTSRSSVTSPRHKSILRKADTDPPRKSAARSVHFRSETEVSIQFFEVTSVSSIGGSDVSLSPHPEGSDAGQPQADSFNYPGPF